MALLILPIYTVQEINNDARNKQFHVENVRNNEIFEIFRMFKNNN